ncbi:MAG TPA: glycosyltransferase, partial [Terriglobales bacterium]|nr:glycosyltransferase [Terriglobales bacterium]
MSSSTITHAQVEAARGEASALRFLYISDFPPSEENGGRILLKRLLQAHPPENICVFTLSAALRTSTVDERLRCRHVGFPILYRSRNWLLTRIKHAVSWLMVGGISLAAAIEIWRRKPNVILTILHGRLYFAAAAAGALTETPYIVFVHDDRVSQVPGASCFWRRVGKPLTGLVLRHAAHVYSVSPGMQRFLRAEFHVASEVQWPATQGGGPSWPHLPQAG